MIHDFKQKRLYQLVPTSIWNRVASYRKDHEKVRYSKALSRATTRKREAAKEAVKNRQPVTEPAEVNAKPLLLAQGKLRSFDVVIRLALAEAGVTDKHRDNAAKAARNALLKKAGKQPKPFRPKTYVSVVPELTLRTSQASLAMTCGCDVRTIQRHLDDFEAIGLVKRRQQLAPDRHKSPTFQLLLNADFLEWLEIRVNANGTTVADGADSGPVAAPVAAPVPVGTAAGPEPPGGVLAAHNGLAALTALRQKLSFTTPQTSRN